MMRVVLSILVAAFMVTSLAACGRKGDPEIPAGQTDTLTKYKFPPDDDKAVKPAPADDQSK